MLIAPFVAALVLLCVVAELVRRRRLREEFSWMWILAASSALVLSTSSQARHWLGALLGTDDDTHTSIITLGLVFLAGICLDLSSKVSRLANQQKTLAQDLSRLHKQVDDLEPRAPEPD